MKEKAMIEVEIRSFIKEPKKTEELLRKKFPLVREKNQTDEYFLHPSRDFFEKPTLREYLRIRTEPGKKNLEYLQAHIQNGHKTHSTEFEAKIEEPEKTREILLQLGFKPWLTVKKNRKAFDCTDFEADLDFIEGLGCFLEIEAKKSFGSIEKTEKKCVEFLESLGIEFLPTPEKGYPELLLEKVAKKQ